MEKKSWFNEKFMPAVYKFSQFKVLVGIRDGISIIIPFTIVGSIFLIIGNFPVQSWLDYISQYATFFDSVVNVTFGALGLIAAIGIGYNMAVQFEVEPISNAVLTVVAFLLATEKADATINSGAFDATGMFTAILISIFVTLVYRFFVKKKIVIRMPDGVPAAVANSFVSLIPGAVIIITIWLVRAVLGVDINSAISALFSPLVSGIASLPGTIIYLILYSFFWILGIHGDLMFEGITAPIWLALLAENVAALSSGSPIPNVMADGFVAIFVNIGGTGGTLALVLMMLKSRCKRYKELGKLSLLPALFNINEPIIFGFPIVMNPIMAVPFILTGLANGVGTYLLMQLNIIGRIATQVPWTTPSILGAYLCTNGSITALIWAVIEIVIAYFIYLPFFKHQEKAELENEKTSKAA